MTRVFLPEYRGLDRLRALLAHVDVIRLDPSVRSPQPGIYRRPRDNTGKHVTLDGAATNYQTGPVYWGELGTNGQHSFYQLIHQGTRLIPCDFIAFGHAQNPLGRHHDILLAKVFVQSEALAFGKTSEQVKTEGTPDWLVPIASSRATARRTLSWPRSSPRRCSASWSRSTSTPYTRGQGVIWGVDSFDQWGVELGKVLAQGIIPELESKEEPKLNHDSSTISLIRRYRKYKETA